MNKPSHTIVDMAEVQDELTPRQQQFMIMRAKVLTGRNKLEAKGILFDAELHQLQLKSAAITADTPDDEAKVE